MDALANYRKNFSLGTIWISGLASPLVVYNISCCF